MNARPEPEPPSRTHLIELAIRQELERFREEIDRNPDLRSISIHVKLNRGAIRLVTMTRESERSFPG